MTDSASETGPRLTQTESDWLALVRTATCAAGHARCSGPSEASLAGEGTDADGSCWPGYIGPDVAPQKNVLVVGDVRGDVAKKRVLAAERDALNTATRKLLKGVGDGSAYLTESRTVYGKGLSREWVVGKTLMPILRRLEMTADSLAFANAAPCQHPVVQDSVARKVSHRSCREQFPIATLAAVLQPQAILFTSVAAYDSYARPAMSGNAIPVCFHPALGYLTRPLSLSSGRTLDAGSRRNGWSADLAKEIVARSK